MMKTLMFNFFIATMILFFTGGCSDKHDVPRVIVTTDINDGLGDPDDRQSLCHLLYYANELDIRAFIPDRFSDNAINACNIAIDLYEEDYNNKNTKFKKYNYPKPDYFRNEILISEREEAMERVIEEAHSNDSRPLYILVWGNMHFIRDVLFKDPSITDHIRLLTIGTNLRLPEDAGDCKLINWNGPGRNDIYNDPRFNDMWWLENDWTYNGMFGGQETVEVKEKLAQYGGKLGEHIKYVISTVQWADNFRAGDTPSVLYLVDPDNDLDNPSKGSWAGQFIKPLPDTRPNYWTGVNGGFDWNYENPCDTWEHAGEVLDARIMTMKTRRSDMYKSMIKKIKDLYGYDQEKQ